jgi:shikimate dehydrogenase
MGVPYAELIGDPVAHSKSPLIHRFWLEKLRMEGDYRLVRLPADGLATYFASRRTDPEWRGCNVTLPYKQKIMPLLDEERIYATDAVNCVVREEGRLIGFNTDAAGVGAALDDGIDTGAPVCIIGAGGAASAAVAQLDILAVFQVNVIVRSRARGSALVEPYGEYGKVYSFHSAREAIRGCVALINATPLGMRGFEPMPETVLASLGQLSAEAFVLDMVYSPVRTDLLCRAQKQGLRAVDGLTVLIGQARQAFRYFFGADAPREHDAELRRLLLK